MNNNKETALRQTPLHPMHLQLGARMVPFAGYDMPVNYPGGIMSEHRHTRDSAGLFDVSHMGQIEVRGEHVAARLESELPVDLVGLPVGRQRYALLLNDDGGIRDDLMAINRGDSFWLVVNAACKHADLDYLERKLGARLDFTLREDLALLALQGPASPGALAAVGADADALEGMRFMQVGDLRLAGVDCMVSRSGYTGEDGFEISLPADRAASLAGALLEQAAVEPVGLGARDSLRLEAGLCLYGQDIGPETSPVEAGLRWAISPARRSGGARPGGFPGADGFSVNWTGGRSAGLSACCRRAVHPCGPVRRCSVKTARPSAKSPAAASARRWNDPSAWGMFPYTMHGLGPCWLRRCATDECRFP